jgi:CTP synthase (UTP-ammonia lyase)
VSTPTIALVGDYSAEVIAHQAIPEALRLSCETLSRKATWAWVSSASIKDAKADLDKYAAIWVVPRSPYENMQGVLDAVTFARTSRRPLLGTCGGFQHALIEFARSVAGIPQADHAETNPASPDLVISTLITPMIEKTGKVSFVEASRIARAYASLASVEEYHCSFGLNPDYRSRLEQAGLLFSAFDAVGQIRGAELVNHPFFVGTLFQPERVALKGSVPPLVTAFVRAATS